MMQDLEQDPALATHQNHPLVFTGKGSEYFGIWIVNLLLSIVTLGIYSAWAKVRRTQYFYRNTRLAGASFDYHGNPLGILKGRLIAFGMLVVYNLAGMAHPYFGLAVGALLLCLLPRLLLKSLQFRLHNSSYRGLRFRFTGQLNDAYIVFLLLPLASLFSLYLLTPFCHQRIKRYQHNHSAFGQTPFAFDAPVGAFYRLYLKVFGIALVCIILAVFVISTWLGNPFTTTAGRSDPKTMFLFSLAPLAILVVAFFFIRPFMEARLQNLIWNHTRLDAHRFISTVSARRLFGIMLTNLIGVVLTLGLYRPFAVARLHKYRAEAVTLVAAGSLDDFIAGSEAEINAVGEETAEMFDVDIAL